MDLTKPEFWISGGAIILTAGSSYYLYSKIEEIDDKIGLSDNRITVLIDKIKNIDEITRRLPEVMGNHNTHFTEINNKIKKINSNVLNIVKELNKYKLAIIEIQDILSSIDLGEESEPIVLKHKIKNVKNKQSKQKSGKSKKRVESSDESSDDIESDNLDSDDSDIDNQVRDIKNRNKKRYD